MLGSARRKKWILLVLSGMASVSSDSGIGYGIGYFTAPRIPVMK